MLNISASYLQESKEVDQMAFLGLFTLKTGAFFVRIVIKLLILIHSKIHVYDTEFINMNEARE